MYKKILFLLMILAAVTGCSNEPQNVTTTTVAGITGNISVMYPAENAVVMPPFEIGGLKSMNIERISVSGTGMPITAQISDATWKVTFQPGQIGFGQQVLTFYGKDNDNNTIASKTYTLWVTNDTDKPIVTINAPFESQTLATSDVAVSGTAYDDGDYQSGVSKLFADMDGNGYTEIDIEGINWSHQFTALEDGSHTASVYARDVYNNFSETNSVTFTVNTTTPDTTIPTISITVPTSGSTVTQDSLSVSGTANDPGDPSSGVAAVYVSMDSATAFDTASGTAAWNADYSSLSEGAHTARAYAVDGTGLHSLTNTVSFTVDTVIHDTTPPEMVVQNLGDGSVITNSSYTVNGTANDPGDPSSGVAAVYVALNCSTCFSPVSGTTVWTTNLSGMFAGPQAFYYFVEDTEGNVSITNSFTFNVVITNTNDTGAGTYYDGVNTSLNDNAFKAELHDLIDNHTVISYTGLWTAFQTTDDRDDNGKVWDMYSDDPTGPEPYLYTFGSDQCGTYSGEGSCYNREHSWPKSWFGGETGTPMYSDLFHLVPTDGYVNGKRSNYPFGEVGSATWTSANGSKLGSCSVSGYSDTVFEPIDEYKGDFARNYFYMSTRYYGEDGGWPVGESGMVDGANIKTWAEDMLRTWHANDPVSQKEIDRNNAIEDIQHNRNPFIDHPEWVNKISDF